VRPITRPTIPSSHIFPLRSSGVGGGRWQKVKATRSTAKDKVKASRTKAEMSSSGSEGEGPASVDNSGVHDAPPSTSSAPVGGVIQGVALPASQVGDAPPPILLVLLVSPLGLNECLVTRAALVRPVLPVFTTSESGIPPFPTTPSFRRRSTALVWTEARCPRSVPFVLGGVSARCVGRGSSRPLREG